MANVRVSVDKRKEQSKRKPSYCCDTAIEVVGICPAPPVRPSLIARYDLGH